MSQQCPYCAAPLPKQDGGAAETAMVCPQCGSELSADLVSPSLAPDTFELSDADELEVDFSLADNEPATQPPEEPVVDEQAIEWLDETPLVEEAASPAENAALDVETASRESAEDFFGLDDSPSTPPAANPLDDDDDSEWKLADDDAVVATSNEQGGTTNHFGENAPMVRQPFDTMDADVDPEQPPKRRKSILQRLVGGVVLTAVLLLGAAVVQLLCWWIVRLDPLNVAFMLPKSIDFVAPYSLTEDGRKAAMSKAVRTDPAGGYDEEDEELPAGIDNLDAEVPADDLAEVSEATDPAAPATDDVATESMSVPESTLVETPPPTAEISADDGTASRPPENDTDFVPATDLEPQPPPDDRSFAAAEPTMEETVAPAEDSAENMDAMTEDSGDDLFGFEDTSAEESSDPVVEDAPKPSPPIINVPVFRVADLRSATTAAAEATEQLNEAKLNRVANTELKEIARDFYKSLCELGETGTLVEPGGAIAELNDARELLENLAQDASKLRMIGTSSVGWLASRLGDGIVVAGTVESSQAVGNFQEVTVRPTGKDGTLVVVTPRELAAAGNILTVGSDVLMAGYVVRNPSLQLPDYLSTANEVIWINNLVVATP